MADASDKNENFHRLAGKRVEAIEDALRIFSNLCGPSYDRSPEEVMLYFGRIDRARDIALDRFKEQKWWRDAAPLGLTNEDPLVEEDPTDGMVDLSGQPIDEQPEDDFDPNARTKDALWFMRREARRNLSIVELIRDGENDTESLARTVTLQREVIERLQRELELAQGQAAM